MTMTKKLFALFATLPVATLGAAGFALADDTGDTYVGNWNSAYVLNIVGTGASTGGNSAAGGNGGEAGAGGDVILSDDGNMGGMGGNGGAGGNGGSITTGNAGASTLVKNVVNTNDTLINRCGCGDQEGEDTNGDDVVMNFNGWGEEEGGVYVGTLAETGAGTGANNADGGSGYYGEEDSNDGGSVVESGDKNVGGNGGSNGDGGMGGTVKTGNGSALADILNMVNTNITRILR